MGSADPIAISTDQVAAFVELARRGSLREAARELHITEQGLRNRLISLEDRLGVELYRKRRGRRQATPLTNAGQRLLPLGRAFLSGAADMLDLFAASTNTTQSIRVLASQYLIHYLLIDAVKRLHAVEPDLQIRLSARTETDIADVLRTDAEVCVGLAAPYEPSPELDYTHLFSMDWSLIAPRGHTVAKSRRVRLKDLCDLPLILLERGSTGRHHIMDAFNERGLHPHVEMEATNTDTIVRMVEAGLGVSVVPLMKSGIVTRGRRVSIQPLGQQVRPIHSGVLTRKGDPLPEAARRFVEFIQKRVKAAKL